MTILLIANENDKDVYFTSRNAFVSCLNSLKSKIMQCPGYQSNAVVVIVKLEKQEWS